MGGREQIPIDYPVPVLAFVGFSGSGKTTLLTRLIPLLREAGIRPALVKHAHHDFDIDTPGKDSYELRRAGASPVVVASRRRWAMISETPDRPEPRLADLLARLDPTDIDIVLVEGFKHEAVPKVEVHRPGLGHPLLFPSDPDIVAVATDEPLPGECGIPTLDLAREAGLLSFTLGLLKGR